MPRRVRLTDKQMHVLNLLFLGKTSKEISSLLGFKVPACTDNTVNRLKQIFNSYTRTGLIYQALKHGVLIPPKAPVLIDPAEGARELLKVCATSYKTNGRKKE